MDALSYGKSKVYCIEKLKLLTSKIKSIIAITKIAKTKASGTEGVSSGQIEFCNCNNKYNKKNGAITRTAYTK